jgi:hypothetical protein
MQGLTAQGATEDIETVLSRFQSWTGSRTPKAITDSVRELSYEEALASSRYRWKGRDDAQPAGNPEDTLRTEPGVVPVASPESPMPEEVPIQKTDKTDEPEFGVIAPEARGTGTPRTAQRARQIPRGRQQFSDALAQSATFGGAGLTRSWRNGERQVAMSLRVAASEQALIKLRAAEAGVSASAYLRQCALDVEILRAQVQQFMAASVRSRPGALREASLSEASNQGDGWLSRLMRRLGRPRSTELRLRA